MKISLLSKKAVINKINDTLPFIKPLVIRMLFGSIKAYNKASNVFKPFRYAAKDFERDLQKALGSNENDRALMMQFLKEKTLYDLFSYYLCGPHYRFPWAGMQMSKLPMDIPIYSDLIAKAKPNLIVEIGTQRGSSSIMLAELASNTGAKVVTIDITSPDEDTLSEFKEKGVIFIQTDATEKNAYEEVVGKSGLEEKDITALIIDDGSHREEHVLKSFKLFCPLVREKGFFIVEDGFSNWMIQKKSHDALTAVDTILEEENEFERYTVYDEFMLASAYQGILQRVKL